MPGVPGAGGPVPKRSSQRRRTNSPDTETATSAGAHDAPTSDPNWHPTAKRWFESLGRSGQSQFYEPSDWATASVIAESMSREFNLDEPPKAASLAAWLKGMTSLMVTEGDRRRARLELERAQPTNGEEAADVSELAIYRRRLQSG